jgi:diaminopimelate epimerase
MILFHKYQGAGNDMILIDNRLKNYRLTKENVATLCNRRLGVGADGLILLGEGGPEVDFEIKYYNSDGNEGSFCGNGTRCAVAFAHFLEIIFETCDIKACDGVHSAIILNQTGKQYTIALEMNDVAEIVKHRDGYFLDTGSPHFVTCVKEDIFELDVLREGSILRNDLRFPAGCNANFITPYKKGVYVRTYERGVEDETLSCGTGVTASALAWAMEQNYANGKHTIDLMTQGGAFQVEFVKNNASFSDVKLIGVAEHVFEGEFFGM